MIRGIESLDTSREVSNLSKIDDIFEKRPHGAGSFKDIEDGKVYFVLWSFSNGVYSFRFITQDGEKVASANSGALFGSVISGLKDAPVSMVAPTKTIQAVLDENGRSVVIQGMLGTYLALLFPIDSSNTKLRFFSTVSSDVSRTVETSANTATLSQAYASATAFTYEETTEDLSSAFAPYLSKLVTLGFTNVAWDNAPIIRRSGGKRNILGSLKFTNSTGENISIPSSTPMMIMPSNDLPSHHDYWSVADLGLGNGLYINQSIDSSGVFKNEITLTVLPGTHFIVINFDYSI